MTGRDGPSSSGDIRHGKGVDDEWTFVGAGTGVRRGVDPTPRKVENVSVINPLRWRWKGLRRLLRKIGVRSGRETGRDDESTVEHGCDPGSGNGSGGEPHDRGPMGEVGSRLECGRRVPGCRGGEGFRGGRGCQSGVL